MVDKVRPLKLESTATGGDDNDFTPTATDPSEDYISCYGTVFQDDDNTRLEKDNDGDIVAISNVAGVVKLRNPLPLIIALS
jgi:hypothetical protein